ncbi:MAG: glycosyl hydrolase [Ruminococcus callidus]|nr:glycosyl hydrolase [Ruminococcus callidus]
MKITTANPNATPKARALLAYLHEIAGKKIIAGQHTQTVPMEEVTYIQNVTGKSPKLCGFELLSYSPNINFSDASEACIKEVVENRNTVETALQWAKQTGGIVTLTFHWFSPVGGRDKSFYTEHTDFNAANVLLPDTPERVAFFHDMDVIAEQLKRFQKADIPVLWRPFHEAEGTWFWWGAQGPAVAKELYLLMFDYYTHYHHFDHLIWVWNSRLPEGYPGDDVVDVVSVDVYPPKNTVTDYATDYTDLIAASSQTKVAALAEVGILPDVEKLAESHIPWAYFMTWSKEFCIGEEYNSTKQLQKLYESKNVITL